MCMCVCVCADHSQTACRDLAQRNVRTELLVSSGRPAHSVAIGRSHTARTPSQQELQPKPTPTSVLGREVSGHICLLLAKVGMQWKIANVAPKIVLFHWSLSPSSLTNSIFLTLCISFPQSVLPSGEHRRSLAAAAHQ